ncbi:bifunctional tRNA (adenosine(37)-N6)-threonylcarbamoyltransferase complex ATPase subunit type 1 TsaE/phosphotransferase [Nocardiopsis terrae]|uniref:tRNA threonylcarbamoyladenosine biosynthesis protein TsaE n=1 Tax=Nocardiopsis terrae TaxID=372655 RepID=A0ABR9HBD1_9ACTN|nr:tRNA (adenosine(37)-N6)-threonylcarbamoyltransferase complex ATPase subunit type 1 TsaE [Nocardiopsis terrae]MBE1456344.1 tRNA threonylcarbamoyladenosine biosynthesis protein TsaE [Nocardiopsis terrae]GHC77386.1 bifunctional tRNA (adenosine(37)-N6)-threonylcarbamoyltransferase complex ATPase subunit type 1 TsaE/phosphotransferase [Nocardiopsis terrae]
MTDTTATTTGALRVHAVTAATDEEMRVLGRDLAALARPGDLLILSGPLGAGKTTFTQGLGQGLGVRGSVTSPTFIISRIHPSLTGGPALVHVDAYRLGGPAEIDDIDLDMTLPESVTVVEWGEGVAEGLADDRLEIRIERHPDDTRTVHLRPVGARWADIDLPGTVAGRG